MMTGVECDREAWPDIPTPRCRAVWKRSGELWVANPEVVSGPRGGTKEEEEPRRLQILNGQEATGGVQPWTEAVT